MTADNRPPHVLVVGGGVAALELLLALRVLAGGDAAITVLSGDEQLAPRAMTVAEPFRRGGAQTFRWSQIADHQHARLVHDRLVAVDSAEHIVFTHGGRRLPYDILAIATGAGRVEPFTGAVTFGAGPAAAGRLRALVADLCARGDASVAFVLPAPSIWPLPLYELALLTAHELREHGSRARVTIVTPEQSALELFGSAASEAIEPMLELLGVELLLGAQARTAGAAGVHLGSGRHVAADHVVTLAEIVARPVAGLPVDRAGFIPVDLHGHVVGEPAAYAAGEATAFPLRQGGLATQQADAVAASIAAACGVDCDPAPFRPVLRGRMLTTGAPMYLQSRPSGQSLASMRPLWSPPEKIAGRYLAPYLSSARPGRIAAAPLTERVPPIADATGGDGDAVRLAMALAKAEARCGNRGHALCALDAAHALDPDHRGFALDALDARPATKVPAQ